jgi:hypothetical protein
MHSLSNKTVQYANCALEFRISFPLQKKTAEGKYIFLHIQKESVEWVIGLLYMGRYIVIKII